MSGRRLCEVREEMREPVYRIGERESDGVTVLRKWNSLQCPFAGHCDKSGPCRGFTPENNQILSELRDRLFVAGFTYIENVSPHDLVLDRRFRADEQRERQKRFMKGENQK